MKAGQELSPESPGTGTDAVPTAPVKLKEFSDLVLLMASTENGGGVGSLPKGVHCITSPEMSAPDTLGRTFQVLPAEEQGGPVQPSPRAFEQKYNKPDTGEFQAWYPWPCMLRLGAL